MNVPISWVNFDELHNIAPGKHMYQFYRNAEDYMRVMIPYFQSGLHKGEACLWIVSEKIGIEHARVTAEAEIERYLFYVACGQFQIVSAEEWYFTEGRMDEEKSLLNAQRQIERIQKQGYHRLRGAGDMGTLSRENWPRAHDYEHKIAEMVKGQPVIALCAYPILECTITDTKNILEEHDGVLMGHF
ncbi:MAG: MEDS domain-containing protein [Candidatus Omnitrophota bacterium]|nr:MEDS domain-containing protein [Candidatus Omnitrophota bacterium]